MSALRDKSTSDILLQSYSDKFYLNLILQPGNEPVSSYFHLSTWCKNCSLNVTRENHFCDPNVIQVSPNFAWFGKIASLRSPGWHLALKYSISAWDWCSLNFNSKRSVLRIKFTLQIFEIFLSDTLLAKEVFVTRSDRTHHRTLWQIHPVAVHSTFWGYSNFNL